MPQQLKKISLRILEIGFDQTLLNKANKNNHFFVLNIFTQIYIILINILYALFDIYVD